MAFVDIVNFDEQALTKQLEADQEPRILINDNPQIRITYDYHNDGIITATSDIHRGEIIEAFRLYQLVQRVNEIVDTTLLLNCTALECSCPDCKKNGLKAILPTGNWLLYKKDDEKDNAVLQLNGGINDGNLFGVIKATKDIAKGDEIVVRTKPFR